METATLRIVDASLNRAAEGLRVVEDYARFVLDDRHLTELAKRLRHDLAAAAGEIASADRHAARDTSADVGCEVTTAAEGQRENAFAVCVASLERTKQALRSLEEYGKPLSPDFGGRVEAIRYRFYTFEKAITATHRSQERLAGVRLYVLMDGHDSTAELLRTAGRLVEAGVGALQLRDKHLSDRDLIERARALVEATHGTETLAIINDRPDIAVAAHADGVHLGQDEMSVKDARSIVGPRALVGVSTHNLDQARQGVLNGADYLGVGPTFPSSTKLFDAFPGLDYLRQVAAETSLPTFAIGGINAGNLGEVLATGIERVAVSGAVVGAEDPAAAVAELLAALQQPAADAQR